MNKITLVLVVLTATLLGSQTVEAASPPPNVIMIVVNDVGFTDVAFNGNPVIKPPNLDSMASQGVLFY